MTVETKAQSGDDFSLCPKFEKTFGILGKKWNGLIIDVLLFAGVQRFSDLSQKIPECSDRVLVERLKELVKEGLVVRQSIDGSKHKVVYELTEQGKDLAPIFNDVHAWAERWFSLEDCV
ncbi:transcriptional regulator, HxlR family [Ligilactobacillus sp. WC1T17]|uniref:Transcriptional regulator, HxlR family n=1 Tax=Ligilactobacillus ruminis TaxID=1623 RepID=A0ABY1ABK0_9LACO|nr:transcriptional regulator, HxlR family [Ligilactobacillus ruminis]